MSAMRDEIVVDAPPEAIYRLASATDRWGEYLPHYRFVRVLQRDGERQIVEMAAKRGLIPVRWTAEQRNDPVTPSIFFKHLTGWTRGMEVVWRFEPRGARTLVSIDHDIRFASPIASEWLAKHVAGDFFIHNIAGKTLARMKALAEAAHG
ncbi:MAG: type II toxin-antitoxin system RatA family toxin [Vulcanimicrobiaceae bacterium]